MKRATLLLETTEISAQRTAGEIISQLVAIGADQVNQIFDQGKLVGIHWVLTIHGQHRLFEMPVRTIGVFKILQSRRTEPWRFEAKDREQAERVAWRQLLAWVKVQVAMIQTEMVEAREVFLPYMYDPHTKQTLFQFMEARGFPLALPAPEKPQ